MDFIALIEQNLFTPPILFIALDDGTLSVRPDLTVGYSDYKKRVV